MFEYINVIYFILFFTVLLIVLWLFFDSISALKKSNNRVYDIESRILDSIELLKSDSARKETIMNKIFESVQNNEREMNFLYKKVDMLTQDFYKRIIKIEQEIKDIKENIGNGSNI
jgi:hypothetical protein